MVGWPTVPVPFVFPHVVSGGNAKTIQFPKRSLAGFGIAFPTVYGPKHIAIPSPSVRVGTIYNLKTDEYGPPFSPKKKLSVGHLNGNPKIPGIGRYAQSIGHRFPGKVSSGIPFPMLVFSVLNIG